MKENGMRKLARETAKAIKSGLTAPSTKATGRTIKPTAREDSSTLMATSTKVTGETIRLMATGNTCTLTVHNMKVNGRKTSSTAKARKPGRTVLATKATT